jgi:hypothetical protein
MDVAPGGSDGLAREGFWFCFGMLVGLALYSRLANFFAAVGKLVGQLGLLKPTDRVPRDPDGHDRP